MANILFDIGHPAHVHLFRNMARRLEAEGHKIFFSALDREMVVYLLQKYQLPYEITYKRRSGKFGLLLELVRRTFATYRIAHGFAADMIVGIGMPTAGIPSRILGIPYLALTDTDHATEQHALFRPFAAVIATPSVFRPNLGPKHIRYNAYHELAYLHPEEFTPDENVLKPLGLKAGEPFFVVRFVAWGATHDIGNSGFSHREKQNVLRELSQRGRVLLSVEGDVEPEFASYLTDFSPEIVHHLLAFATLYIGEGGTMLTEAAILGTPAIFVSTLRAGTWDDLRDNYQLLDFFSSGSEAILKIRDLLATPDLKRIWAERRQHLLDEKINPTPWFVQLINRMLTDKSHQPQEL